MQLKLIREYFSDGTNGQLFMNNNTSPLCFTIELPWKNNQTAISCIPEGTYGLQKRYSPRFKQHLHLINVKDRSLILIHPANNALKELRGCIAPVTKLQAPGIGTGSRQALKCLLEKVSKAFESKEPVFLTVSAAPDRHLHFQKSMHETDNAKDESTHTALV